MKNIENNKLIVEFLGWSKAQELEGGYEAQFEPCDQRLPSEMDFHKSWDWLMPVLEKLETEYCIELQWFQRMTYLRIVLFESLSENDGEKLFEGQYEGSRLECHYNAILDILKYLDENKVIKGCL